MHRLGGPGRSSGPRRRCGRRGCCASRARSTWSRTATDALPVQRVAAGGPRPPGAKALGPLPHPPDLPGRRRTDPQLVERSGQPPSPGRRARPPQPSTPRDPGDIAGRAIRIGQAVRLAGVALPGRTCPTRRRCGASRGRPPAARWRGRRRPSRERRPPRRSARPSPRRTPSLGRPAAGATGRRPGRRTRPPTPPAARSMSRTVRQTSSACQARSTAIRCAAVNGSGRSSAPVRPPRSRRPGPPDPASAPSPRRAASARGRRSRAARLRVARRPAREQDHADLERPLPAAARPAVPVPVRRPTQR